MSHISSPHLFNGPVYKVGIFFVRAPLLRNSNQTYFVISLVPWTVSEVGIFAIAARWVGHSNQTYFVTSLVPRTCL